MRKYSANSIIVDIEKVQQHEFNKLIGNRPLDLYLTKEINQYSGVLQAIAIKEDASNTYHVVSNYELVQKAHEEKAKEIELLVVDCPFNDAPRVYNLQNSFSKSEDMRETFKLIVYLKNHMQTTEEGKRWKRDLPGKYTRDKLALLLGYKEGSTITKIIAMGIYAPSLLDSYVKGDITFEEAYETAAAIQREQENAKADNVRPISPERGNETPPDTITSLWSSDATPGNGSFVSTASDTTGFEEPTFSEGQHEFSSTITGDVEFTTPIQTAPPVFNPQVVRLFIEEVGELELDFSNHDVRVSLNGEEKSGFIHRITNSKEAKSLQLIKGGQAVVSITVIPSQINA